MKFYLSILIAFVFLSLSQNQLFAQSDQIAAVYYNEKPPVERSTKVAKKQVQQSKYPKQTAKKKTPIIEKTQSYKIAGIVLIIVGSIALAIGITILIIGLMVSIINGGVLILGGMGLAALILGLVFLGKAKRKESGR